MKNSNSSNQYPNKSFFEVFVTLNEASMLQNLVEKLAHRRYSKEYSSQEMPEGWLAFDTSSIEACVNGDIDIFTGDGSTAIFYTTCFYYTCTKFAGEDNTLTWANSLS